ncbi:MAG: B12-binding domain-containing radical SAM protein [Deltaproteobacteria bacterium]|nr:B12-binding domain-containing radical SAM protein [Deltaproteobacteria bacterium]
MKIIVLEHPRIRSGLRFNDIANTPLWSCLMGGYVASALKAAGHEVCFIDCTVNGWDFPKAADEITAFSPALLAVNCVYMWEKTGAIFSFFQNLRSAGFKGHINLFGFYPTLAYRTILRFRGEVDTISVGECEITVKELASCLESFGRAGEIAGLAHWSGEGIHMAGPRSPHRDPDLFNLPLRADGGFRTASILGSRGCYNHCSFCPVPSFYNQGPLWRGRSPENILLEMKSLISTGIRDFYFADPNFIGPGKKGKERTLRLMELIRPLQITFGMETRPEDLDEEIMESLVSSGFTSMLLGVESGSKTLLSRLSKGSTLNNSERAISLCRSFGIEPEIGFLMFVPDSTLSDLSENLEFLRKNNLLNRLDRTANLFSHNHIVLMGTSGYQRYEKEGRLIPAGYLGFEGEIEYADERVGWIQDVVVFACHHVLRQSGFVDSPIHWRKPQEQGPAKWVNDYLVKMFERLLKNAESLKTLDEPEMVKKDIEMEINREIWESPFKNKGFEPT